jgi:dTDP-4-amino-4,6-dideoxygalactose transaminase
MHKIPFNKPYLTGKEEDYISQVFSSNHISGNGRFTKECQLFFESKYNIRKCLLTTSCTDALEMAAILAKIEPGDEVIMPSYTFVSTANAFVLRGAKIVFADSRKDHPGIDEGLIEELITPRTKAIVPVHYAGVSCDMDIIMDIAKRHNIYVIEDAAQAIDNYFTGIDGVKRALGSIGHLSAFSFHETKNIIAGEGGLIAINDEQFVNRAEIIWEKGTNRSAFFRGEVNKYGWVDIGSSFLPSEVTAAFLKAQLDHIEIIQHRRIEIWNRYYTNFEAYNTDKIQLPFIPKYSTNNAHMFYIICENSKHRKFIIDKLKQNNIYSVFHYISLHSSEFARNLNPNPKSLKNTDNYTNCLLRLPFFIGLTNNQIDHIVDIIMK